MEYTSIYQILKLEYGSVSKVAHQSSVTTQTVTNILVKNAQSEKRDIVIAAAKEVADTILFNLQQEATQKITELQTAIAEYSDLRQQLAA